MAWAIFTARSLRAWWPKRTEPKVYSAHCWADNRVLAFISFGLSRCFTIPGCILSPIYSTFVRGSPVYHNSFSGILKNALDSLSIQQFRNKPVALMSCGNSDRTGSQPCDHLRIVARGLLAVAIPTQVITLPSDFTFAQGRYR